MTIKVMPTKCAGIPNADQPISPRMVSTKPAAAMKVILVLST